MLLPYSSDELHVKEEPAPFEDVASDVPVDDDAERNARLKAKERKEAAISSAMLREGTGEAMSAQETRSTYGRMPSLQDVARTSPPGQSTPNDIQAADPVADRLSRRFGKEGKA
jgi:hypothetical protein